MTPVDADGGFALIDAIVALAVLMIVFLPAAMLMMSTTRVTGDYRAKMVAESIASGILAQERSAAANSSCLYTQSVLDLNPSAYWPMNDPSQTAPKVSNASSQGSSYNGAANNAAGWDQVPGPVSCDTSNGALAFNGLPSPNGTYVSTPVPNPTGTQFSVVAWFKFSGYTGNPRVVANDHTDCTDRGFQLAVNSGGASGFFDVGNGTGQPQLTCGGTGGGMAYWSSHQLTTGTWYFYAGTYNGSSVVAYINGQQVASAPYSGGAIATPACSCGVSLGYNPSYAGDFVDGQLADVAIWDSAALTGSQVQALYQAASGTYSFPPQAPVALPKLWYPAASWCPGNAATPPTPCAPITQVASGITFTSYVTGGWCVLDSSGQWSGYSSPAATVPKAGQLGSTGLGTTYFVTVKTAWGGGSVQTSASNVSKISPIQSVVMSSPLPLPPFSTSISAPQPGWQVTSCPVGIGGLS